MAGLQQNRSATRIVPRRRMLLDLPSELIVAVLGYLDPGSFSVCRRVCRSLRQHTESSTALLEEQLAKVPGLSSRLRQKTLHQLLQVFKRRSAKHLLHGVHALADVVRFEAPSSEKFRFGDSLNCSCRTDHLVLALVRRSDASVGVYSVKSQFPILKCVLSPHDLALAPPGEIFFEVVKVAFYDASERTASCKCVDRIGILYRYRLRDDLGNPFTREAGKLSAEIMKLVTWTFTEAFDATIEEVRDITNEYGWQPRALAMAEDGSAIISMLDMSVLLDGQRSHVSWVKKRPGKFYDPFPPTQNFSLGNSGRSSAPTSIEIIRRRVLFYMNQSPIPQWDMDDYADPDAIHSCGAHRVIGSIPHPSGSCGIPLALHHKHNLVNAAGQEHCLNSVLYLDFNPSTDCQGFFIFKGVQIPEGCARYNPQIRYPAIEHHIVAKLGGFDMVAYRNSSLGVILAISPSGRRIAVATWRRVQVWTICPNAFFLQRRYTNTPSAKTDRATNSSDPNNEQEGPPNAAGHEVSTAILSTSSNSSDSQSSHSSTGESSDGEDGDGSAEEWPWINRCGWDYYECYWPHTGVPIYSSTGQPLKTKRRVVQLPPVEFPSQGVVSGLAWKGEDSLFGWTDRGLVRWQVGPSCSERRDACPLSYTVSEVNALSFGGAFRGKGKMKTKD